MLDVIDNVYLSEIGTMMSFHNTKTSAIYLALWNTFFLLQRDPQNLNNAEFDREIPSQSISSPLITSVRL